MAYSAWAASTAYAVGAVVRATSVQASGLVFRCTVAGTSASTQPNWPTDIGSTIPDGTVTWRAISSVYEELAVIAPNAIIELFQLQLVEALHGANDTYYFHAGVNANVTGNIIWSGQQYIRLPIQAEGFDYSSGGTLPRPTLSVANLGGEISALLLQANAITPGNDLGGAKVTRIRTLKKFLDGEPGADPHAKFPDEIWYVDRKSAETRDVVQWELASKFDMAGMMIPKRQIIANICQWEYRGAQCGYNGPPVADANDQPLTSSLIPELQAYYDAAAIYKAAAADRRTKGTILSEKANDLNTANVSWILLETRYTQFTDGVFLTPGGGFGAVFGGSNVTLNSTYRQGAQVFSGLSGTFYQIQRWGPDTARINAAQSAYNTALSNYNTAVATEASTKVAAEAARDAYLAVVPSGGSPDDVCGKRLSSCRLRFFDLITNTVGELPFGSFPGAGLIQ